ncbi:Chromosome partition protein smc [hydrothermal vent metagenome]|uniref:Chromosome partition protein smc n=1 Tax=hydrothermal vent metagenome TaxID=652676 RepID=A0A3B1BPL0_9ZZZZ
MRLEKIKLAGFKSFVDPTTVPLPSNLVGVVGPNGCGKSNVIDAVRWVMGESSAKHLRGESMADVIFNGSTTRKPVGTATVELVFDNSDGGAGGQYAQYTQISVKRQVSRDGQSLYYLNGVRCRRRDITDLFLGTGLGPRSYSIIEQGTISRLIEARPEELRQFLEEAAGISKYKERRRETENRIRHTRENLERLDDLREEIAKQLQHLKRQASTAERYKVLKQEERQLKAELLVLRWSTLDESMQQQDKAIAEQETALEAAIAVQRRQEAEMEQQREAHVVANEHFNKVQKHFYQVGSEISRLQQSIQYAKDARHQYQQDLAQAEQALAEASDHRQQDEQNLQDLEQILNAEEPQLEDARNSEHAAVEQLANAEQAMHTWQASWDAFNQQATEPAQSAQVERTRINHLEQQEYNLLQRLERLTGELGQLDDSTLVEEIVRLEGKEAEAREQAVQLQGEQEEVAKQVGVIRENNVQRGNELDQVRAQQQAARGRQASLEALQQAALGKQENAVVEWLEHRGLADATRLAEKLDVASEWQDAVETVLGFHLQAVCVEQLDSPVAAIQELDKGSLSLFDTSQRVTSTNKQDAERLISKVSSPWPLDELLGDVRLADDLDQAMAMRDGLGEHESVITLDGIWLGRSWLRLNRAKDEKSGVLAREDELRQISAEATSLEDRAEQLAAEVEQGRQQLKEAEAARENIQQRLSAANRTQADIRAGLGSKRARADHLRTRREAIGREADELQNQTTQDKDELAAARTRLHSALGEMETLAAQRQQLIDERDRLRIDLSGKQEEAGRCRSKAHELALKIEAVRSSRHSLTQGLERMQTQLGTLSRRREELQTSLTDGEAPLQEQNAELEQQLVQRLEVEGQLADARNTQEGIEQNLRKLEQDRTQSEQSVQNERSLLDQVRMQRQEVLVRAKTIDEQLGESGFNREQLIEELSEEATEEQWHANVERMDMRIRRLGAINLAAIDEFQEQSERMEYLDAQHADVTESLETLERAIRKIDKETRTRFKETFDKVNSGLQDMFPKLFGGGHAYLQLTGDDLLDTGVTVMARPPGKRNTSIYLLSGGEKALTAVALVFSIFKLNPAPFCMLDEVDAPLDDANVGRFCELVLSMSEHVQFVFITHNKLTMEIAYQLTGVTMKEPGVSRLVSVDVAEAAKLAAV